MGKGGERTRGTFTNRIDSGPYPRGGGVSSPPPPELEKEIHTYIYFDKLKCTQCQERNSGGSPPPPPHLARLVVVDPPPPTTTHTYLAILGYMPGIHVLIGALHKDIPGGRFIKTVRARTPHIILARQYTCLLVYLPALADRYLPGMLTYIRAFS